MGTIHMAPTRVLPHIGVTVGYGPGTNYPFGRFDLETQDGREKWDLFAALSARVKEWAVECSGTYHRRLEFDVPPGDPPDFADVYATHTGGFPNTTDPWPIGVRDIVLGDRDCNSVLHSHLSLAWQNPHQAEGFNAQDGGFVAHDPPNEENFILPDVRLICVGGGNTVATPTGDLTTEDETTLGAYLVNMSGGCFYNTTAVGDAEADRTNFYYYSYRNRRFGYVAFAFEGAFTFYTNPGGIYIGSGLEAIFNTHYPRLLNLPGSPTQGEVGTFTINWFHPISNKPLSVSCPLYGIPAQTTEAVLSMSADFTMTPSKCYSYGGIFGDDGRSSRDPTLYQ